MDETAIAWSKDIWVVTKNKYGKKQFIKPIFPWLINFIEGYLKIHKRGGLAFTKTIMEGLKKKCPALYQDYFWSIQRNRAHRRFSIPSMEHRQYWASPNWYIWKWKPKLTNKDLMMKVLMFGWEFPPSLRVVWEQRTGLKDCRVSMILK